jgi:hypothetical protein
MDFVFSYSGCAFFSFYNCCFHSHMQHIKLISDVMKIQYYIYVYLPIPYTEHLPFVMFLTANLFFCVLTKA